MSAKSTIKTAAQLLDRFFRDAEGRTNRQIDVYFALEDMDVPRERAEPALEYLKSRGLLNLFGTDIGFLTDKGVQAMVEELDIGTLDKEVRDFIQKPVAPQAAPATPAAPTPAKRSSKSEGSPRPERAQLTHIDLEGGEFTLPLGMRCRIGRADDNEVRINDKRASKHHAELVYSNRRYVLVDLESANGTLLNGEYALEPTPLKHDDEIVIGRTMLLYQAPEVVNAPPAAPKEAPAAPPPREPTPVAAPRAQAPTERPTQRPAPSADDSPSIRVVRGTPAAPTRPPAAGPDLFAEPPTRAPDRDLFADSAPSTPADDGDLFTDEPPTQIPDGPRPPSDDLFGDAPVAPSVSAARGDGLFGDGPSATQGGDDLFSSDPSGAPTPAEVSPMELEPLAGAPELAQGPVPTDTLDVQDTAAADPAIGVDDLWAQDKTPTSDGPDILDNPPVLHDAPPVVQPAPPSEEGDGATLMMDRDALSGPEELPRWSEAGPGLGTQPPFAEPLDAETEALAAEAISGEAMPDASPSLAMPAANPSADLEDPGATMDAAPTNPEFFRLLSALKAEVQRAEVPEQQALLDAIEVLEDHPYVRLALGRL